MLRYVGPIKVVRAPVASLADIQASSRLAAERDLRTAPTPISGGMRKALHKEAAAQNALRYRAGLRRAAIETARCYGLLECVCPRCRHVMYFDEYDGGPVRCDRCKCAILDD